MQYLSTTKMELLSHYHCGLEAVVIAPVGSVQMHVRFPAGEMIGLIGPGLIMNQQNTVAALAEAIHSGYHTAGAMPRSITIISRSFMRRTEEIQHISMELEPAFTEGDPEVIEVLLGRIFVPDQSRVYCIQPYRNTASDGWELSDLQMVDDGEIERLESDMTWTALTQRIHECSS